MSLHFYVCNAETRVDRNALEKLCEDAKIEHGDDWEGYNPEFTLCVDDEVYSYFFDTYEGVEKSDTTVLTYSAMVVKLKSLEPKLYFRDIKPGQKFKMKNSPWTFTKLLSSHYIHAFWNSDFLVCNFQADCKVELVFDKE